MKDQISGVGVSVPVPGAENGIYNYIYILIMVYRIPSRFTYKYHKLGVFTAVIFIMTLLSSDRFLTFPYLHRYEDLLILIFLISVFIYLLFEAVNLKDSRSIGVRYSFDTQGIYRGNYMIIDWADVFNVTIETGKLVKSISVENITDGDNRFMTREPMSNLMAEYNVNEVTKTSNVARIMIHRTYGRRSGPDLIIDTAPFRSLVNRTYSRMLDCVSERSLNVDFEFQDSRMSEEPSD